MRASLGGGGQGWGRQRHMAVGEEGAKQGWAKWGLMMAPGWFSPSSPQRVSRQLLNQVTSTDSCMFSKTPRLLSADHALMPYEEYGWLILSQLSSGHGGARGDRSTPARQQSVVEQSEAVTPRCACQA